MALAWMTAGLASAQTPDCDGIVHWLDVAGTECLDGSRTGIQYVCQAGTSAPLVIDVDSGGACWDAATCQCVPDAVGNCTLGFPLEANAFGRAASFDGLPRAQSFWGQAAAFSGPTSPFNQDWNIVQIPYCTGDAHSGNADRTYTSGSLTVHAHHHGYKNVALDLAVIKSLFPAPSRVAVWGGSAGGYGVACNLSQFVNAYPGVQMAELQNAYAPFDSVATPLMPTVGRNWGAWRPNKDGSVEALTCPIAIPPGTPNAWSELALVNYNHLNFPNVRKAWTDDYSDAMIDAFACALGATPDANGSCAAAVTALLNEGYGLVGDDPSYRVFFHAGICHSERDSDGNFAAGGDPACDYDNMIQAPKANQKYVDDCKADTNQKCFRDWVRGWAGVSGYSWENVK
jgi:hypothetical protein